MVADEWFAGLKGVHAAVWTYVVPDRLRDGDTVALKVPRPGDGVVPDRVGLGNAADLAAAMGINRATAAKLIAAGVAGPVFKTGRGELVLQQTIDRLAALTPIDPADVDLLVLRVSSASPVEEQSVNPDDPSARRYAGWNCWNSDDDNIAGVNRWWHIPDADNRVGKPVVVTVGPVVVGVFRLDSYRMVVGNLRWLNFTSAQDDDYELLADRRLDLPAGSPVVLLAPGAR